MIQCHCSSKLCYGEGTYQHFTGNRQSVATHGTCGLPYQEQASGPVYDICCTYGTTGCRSL